MPKGDRASQNSGRFGNRRKKGRWLACLDMFGVFVFFAFDIVFSAKYVSDLFLFCFRGEVDCEYPIIMFSAKDACETYSI